MRLRKAHNREFVECHKKAWIQLLSILHIYLYNRLNVATIIILCITTILHSGTLVLCLLVEQKTKFFKFAMALSLSIGLINWIIHWLTRTFTSGVTILEIQNLELMRMS